MKTPPVLRKPMKMLLSGALLMVTAGAALLFALQAWLDGIALERSMDAYAYVGTVTTTQSAAGDTDPNMAVLDPTLIEEIQNSPYVTSYDTRTTRAGLLDGTVTVPDQMFTTGRLTQHYFMEGTILFYFGETELSGLMLDCYTLRLNQQWGGQTLYSTGISIYLYRTPEEEPLAVNSHVFLVGSYYQDAHGVRTDSAIVCTAQAAALMGKPYSGCGLCAHGVAVLPEGADAQQWIPDYMEEAGISSLYQQYCDLQNAVTVRGVSDLVMQPYFSSGRIYIDSGRALTPADAGKRVCVISQGLANRNRLHLGDTISLSVADGCYTVSGLSSSANGWESGYPMVGEEVRSYGDFTEYEVVGFYTQISSTNYDPLFFGPNDIFIPATQESPAASRSYNFTFRVEGPGYESFRAALDPLLEEYGGRLTLRDTGWDEVEDTFFLLQDRRTVMLFSAGAAFCLAALLFAVLTCRNNRYTYGLRRMLGATKGEAASAYLIPFALSGLLGLLPAVLAALTGYRLWMRPAMEEVLSVTLPTTGECAVALLWVALAQLALSALVLLVLCALEERRGLLRLIRR